MFYLFAHKPFSHLDLSSNVIALFNCESKNSITGQEAKEKCGSLIAFHIRSCILILHVPITLCRRVRVFKVEVICRDEKKVIVKWRDKESRHISIVKTNNKTLIQDEG